jgi:FADH2 O2-dependent halogenase
MRVLIVGSGFAGTILARVLHRQGHQVLLAERGRHPRFALGESSTPLAALCLERLAARWDLPDLDDLAAYGRWLRAMPQVRRGLKRGFTFYAHRPGVVWPAAGDGSASRLLVAASPNDEVADSHWRRADVDAFLVERAREEGVEVHEGLALEHLERSGDGWLASGRQEVGGGVQNAGSPGKAKAVRLAADLVVDASGAGSFLATALGLRPSPPRAMPATLLLGGHFRGAGDFTAAAAARGTALPPGPYPDELAAVHHLLAEGWLYMLPFDDGVCSAGFVLRHDRLTSTERREAAAAPAEAWRRWLGRYPSLAEQLGGAAVEVGILHQGRLQRRWSAAAGPGWAMLPHAYCFLSPLFSTGIAWSLLGVERLALLLAPLAGRRQAPPPELLDGYGALLRRESAHLARLLAGAYALVGRGELFFAYGLLYFAAASFAEASQRLLPAPATTAGEWAWQPFLGAGDPVVRGALERLRQESAAALATPGAASATAFAASVRSAIAARDVAGLGREDAAGLYPVDLDDLRVGAPLLGLGPDELEAALPRLRLG